MQKTISTVLCTIALVGAVDLSKMVSIPAGDFVMGDHAGLGGGDTKHPSDEVPLHQVHISAFALSKYEVTNQEYVEFLNDALKAAKIQVKGGYVTLSATGDTLTETHTVASYNRILFDGSQFSVADQRENHPVSSMRWKGSIAFCNWMSEKLGLDTTYDLATGTVDYSKNGIRLPTEAEWEYAALGGLKDPYPIFPWGNDTNKTGQYANWQNSGDPYEVGDYPWTTPVGFYNGTKHLQSEFNWPGTATEYQTQNAVNGYGLYDMSGNVWEYVNDWYLNPYYAKSPAADPPGPSESEAGAMPDGKKYKAMRGGNWYNGAEYYGHGRISNRNPSYFRGPQDPVHPYYHIGFRVAARINLPTPILSLNIPQNIAWNWQQNLIRLQMNLDKPTRLQFGIVQASGQMLFFRDLGIQSAGKLDQKWDFNPNQNALGIPFLRTNNSVHVLSRTQNKE